MTIRGKHLQCDGRKFCLSCKINTWPPNSTIPKKYYHCPQCHFDYLCDVGLYVTYHYSTNGQMSKILHCNQCYVPVIEKIWSESKKIVPLNPD